MTDAAVAEIHALEDRRWEAQIAKDLDTLAELYGDSMRYTHSNGMVDTKETFLAAIEKRVFDYRSQERTDVECSVVGDTALVTGRARFHVVVGGDREVDLDARFTVVWARVDGRWQFLCWQSTPIPAGH
jgi:ketosteroid isomerase-like protein